MTSTWLPDNLSNFERLLTPGMAHVCVIETQAAACSRVEGLSTWQLLCAHVQMHIHLNQILYVQGNHRLQAVRTVALFLLPPFTSGED
jgi:hypothetical protein